MLGRKVHQFVRTSSLRQFVRFNSKVYDVAVIGGGPAGYVAAVRAAQLGYKTVCIEKRGRLGGVCYNHGCVSSKSLLNNTELYQKVKTEGKQRGLVFNNDVSPNIIQMMAIKNKAVVEMTEELETLLEKYGVDYLAATASFVDQFNLVIRPIDGSQPYNLMSQHTVIASGAKVVTIPGVEIDQVKICTSTGMLEVELIPKRLTIIGAGVIGLEMATIYSRLGSEVAIIEQKDSIGAVMDKEMANEVQRIFTKQGMKFKTNTKVVTSVKNGDIVNIGVENIKTGTTEILESDVVLVAVGRLPCTKELNIRNIGLETDHDGALLVKDKFTTTKFNNIKAIGDVISGPMLAHKAEEEAIAAIESIKVGQGEVNYNAIPWVMYTSPEIAWVGLTEEELKEKGKRYKVGKIPFYGNPRARINGETEGMIKVLIGAKSHKIFGVHIVGPQAAELIAEATLAIQHTITANEVASTCHAHPTFSEAFKEAAMAAYDNPIHV
jgi:dihydrolipoamide dehydrogenase